MAVFAEAPAAGFGGADGSSSTVASTMRSKRNNPPQPPGAGLQIAGLLTHQHHPDRVDHPREMVSQDHR